MPIQAYVFDAYGTLYDVQSVLARVEAACPGRGAVVTQVWRLKQLEYTWLRTCMGAFADFAAVTRDSLAYALHAAGVPPAEGLVAGLADAYLHLAPAPEARDALQALQGRPRAIFSNGSTAMLAALVRNSGMQDLLEHVVSVDGARAYKPSPAAYALVERETGVPPGQTLFVSSNGFDVAGAKRFGFQVAWVRRRARAGRGGARPGRDVRCPAAARRRAGCRAGPRPGLADRGVQPALTAARRSMESMTRLHWRCAAGGPRVQGGAPVCRPASASHQQGTTP